MTEFRTPEVYKGSLDPDAGFTCIETLWRPVAGAPETELAGEKLSMSSFIPRAPDELCLCGSGKLFRDCCQRRRLWYPICPNPGIPNTAGYSHIKPQKATYTKVPGTELRDRLMEDVRMRCTEDTPERAFWIYEGNPAIQRPEGIMCFGDIELIGNHMLVVTAMSDLRMRVLVDLLRRGYGDLLKPPKIRYKDLHVIDKRTGKLVVRKPDPSSRQR